MVTGVTVLVLAAGRSTRFGPGNKLLADLSGTCVLARTIRAARPLDVVVVTGHDHLAVEAVAHAEGARTAYNPRYADGMGTSIAAGIAAVPSGSGWLIWPGDLPDVRPATVAAVVRRASEGRVVVPACEGRRGHPVFFPPAYGERLLRLDDDRGARALTSAAVIEETGDPGILRDVDTPDDLDAATAAH